MSTDSVTPGPVIPNEEALAQAVRQIAPQAQVVRAWPLAGGISAQMTALELSLPAGYRRVVVRLPGDNAADAALEYRLLQTVVAAGVAAPIPLALDESGQILPRPYLVLEFVDGAPDYRPRLPRDCVAKMAEQLARIHTLDVGAFASLHLPDLRKRLGRLLENTAHSLDARADVARMCSRLEADRAHMYANQPVLLHGDYWPGNILWRAGKLIAVVDWEDAALGEPLSDLAVSRLDLLWIYGMEAADSFTDHYRRFMPALDYTPLPYWDLYAALRALSWLGTAAAGWAERGRPDITETTMRNALAAFAARASAQLDAR